MEKHRYAGELLRVPEGSLADELGLVAGDKILEVNGMALRDIIDVSFAFADEEIDLLVEHADGEQEMISFDKDYDEELGAEFTSAVFDGIRRCANNCYFCFVNMGAPSARASLAIKDDDYRLSFLYGNFVTLTNMGASDFRRIEQFHLSPLYVSVQCMNPELRAEMLRCKRAADIGGQLDRLEAAGADYHTQVVLCAGLNDGAELERTIREIAARRPHALSLAVVPVGVTKYRTDPYPLRQFDAAGAAAVIDLAERWQKTFRAETGRTFLYLGDEFYVLAGRDVPPEDWYDGFPQLDNGIGLMRSFQKDFAEARAAAEADGVAAGDDAIAEADGAAADGTAAVIAPEVATGNADADVYLDVVTGTSVAPMFEALARSVEDLQPQLHVRIVPVENAFWGTTVNVSGLLTGRDILATLRKLDGPRTGVLIPEPALRAGEDIFLDDMTLTAFREALPDARVEPVQGGADYYHALTDFAHYHKERAGETAYMWRSNAGYTKPAE